MALKIYSSPKEFIKQLSIESIIEDAFDAQHNIETAQFSINDIEDSTSAPNDAIAAAKDAIQSIEQAVTIAEQAGSIAAAKDVINKVQDVIDKLKKDGYVISDDTIAEIQKTIKNAKNLISEQDYTSAAEDALDINNIIVNDLKKINTAKNTIIDEANKIDAVQIFSRSTEYSEDVDIAEDAITNVEKVIENLLSLNIIKDASDLTKNAKATIIAASNVIKSIKEMRQHTRQDAENIDEESLETKIDAAKNTYRRDIVNKASDIVNNAIDAIHNAGSVMSDSDKKLTEEVSNARCGINHDIHKKDNVLDTILRAKQAILNLDNNNEIDATHLSNVKTSLKEAISSASTFLKNSKLIHYPQELLGPEKILAFDALIEYTTNKISASDLLDIEKIVFTCSIKEKIIIAYYYHDTVLISIVKEFTNSLDNRKTNFRQFEKLDIAAEQLDINSEQLNKILKKSPVLGNFLKYDSADIRKFLDEFSVSTTRFLKVVEKNPDLALRLATQKNLITQLIKDKKFKIDDVLEDSETFKKELQENMILSIRPEYVKYDIERILISETEILKNIMKLSIKERNLDLTPDPDHVENQGGRACRNKRDQVGCRSRENKQDQDKFDYNPLTDNNLSYVEKVNLKTYSQVSIAISWALSNDNPIEDLNNSIKLLKNINEILKENPSDLSHREKMKLQRYHKKAATIHRKKEFFLKEINPQDISENNKVIIYDNGRASVMVLKADDHYKIYNQNLSVELYKTKLEASLQEVEEYVRSFFKWKYQDANYKTYTISAKLKADNKLVQKVQNAISHYRWFESDYQKLLDTPDEAIDGIPIEIVHELFIVNGKTPSIGQLHNKFFEHEAHKITFRIDKLHKILPKLTRAQQEKLFNVINQHNLSGSYEIHVSSDASFAEMMNTYSNDVMHEITKNNKISLEKLSEISWNSLHKTLVNHPDFNTNLAKDVVDTSKNMHKGLLSKNIIKEAGTQGLFFLPTILKSVNTEQYGDLVQTGGMIAGDYAANQLLGMLTRHASAERAALLNKLPISSPIFKALTIYSVIELNKEVSKLPSNDPRKVTIEHELDEQYVTLGIMTLELFGLEMGPAWILLTVAQLVIGAEDFIRENQLSISFEKGLLMSLGFLQDELNQIFEERHFTQGILEMASDAKAVITHIPIIKEIKTKKVDKSEVPQAQREKLLEIAQNSTSIFTRKAKAHDFQYEVNLIFPPSAADNAPLGYGMSLPYQDKVYNVTEEWKKSEVIVKPANGRINFQPNFNISDTIIPYFVDSFNKFLPEINVTDAEVISWQRVPYPLKEVKFFTKLGREGLYLHCLCLHKELSEYLKANTIMMIL